MSDEDGYPDEQADDHYSKEGIVDQLEKSEGRACLLLAKSIRKLPVYNELELRNMIEELKATPPTSYIAQEEWRRALSVFCLEVSKCTLQLLLNVILLEMKKISPHLRYWKANPRPPAWQRMQRAVDDWRGVVAVSYVAQNRTNVAKLSKMEENFAKQVGVLHKFISEMDKIRDFEQDIEPFRHFIERVDYEYVSGKHRRIDSPQVMLDRLDEALATLPELKDWFEDDLQPLKQPSHLSRHLVTYAGVGLAGVIVMSRLYQNRAAVAASARETSLSLRTFFREHVTEPVFSIYRSIFHTFKDRNSDCTRESLQASRESLRTMIEDYGKTDASKIAQLEGKSVTEFKKSLPDRAARGDMSVVMKKYEDDVRHPIRSSFNGDLQRGLLIQVQKMKVDAEALSMSMDQVLTANEINFNFLATIPAIVLLGFAAVGTKRLVSRLVFHKPDRSSQIEQMRYQLHRIDSMLVRNYTDADQHDLDEQQLGFLLLRLHKLELLTLTLPAQERRLLREDIANLRSLEYTVRQKNLIVAQIYRTHPWLSRDVGAAAVVAV